MNFMFVLILLIVCEAVVSINTKSKQDFMKARNALKGLKSLLKDQATAINLKVEQLDKDIVSLEEDFKSKSCKLII